MKLINFMQTSRKTTCTLLILLNGWATCMHPHSWTFIGRTCDPFTNTFNDFHIVRSVWRCIKCFRKLLSAIDICGLHNSVGLALCWILCYTQTRTLVNTHMNAYTRECLYTQIHLWAQICYAHKHSSICLCVCYREPATPRMTMCALRYHNLDQLPFAFNFIIKWNGEYNFLLNSLKFHRN